MSDYTFTNYFTNFVLPRRPYLQQAWCIRVIEEPLRIEAQPDGRVRFWGRIDEYGGRVLRVVTLPDRTTVLNAFFDRGFQP